MTAASSFRYLLLPVSVLRLFSGYKSFSDPLIGSANLNRRGLHVWRVKLAHKIAAGRRKRLEHLATKEDRDAYAANGFVAKRNVLAPGDYQALLAELKALTAPAREMTEGKAVTRRIAVTPDLLAKTPALARFLKSKEWRGLTRYVGGFNSDPIVCIQTIFGEGSDQGISTDPQTRLHMDTFHPTMKAWLFLEDVAADEGPFTYVPGSHKPTPLRLAWQQRKAVEACEAKTKGGAFRMADSELADLGLPPRRNLLRSRQHAGGRRYLRHARARPVGAAFDACRDLRLDAAEPIQSFHLPRHRLDSVSCAAASRSSAGGSRTCLSPSASPAASGRMLGRSIHGSGSSLASSVDPLRPARGAARRDGDVGTPPP